jgi:hypothetical protein
MVDEVDGASRLSLLEGLELIKRRVDEGPRTPGELEVSHQRGMRIVLVFSQLERDSRQVNRLAVAASHYFSCARAPDSDDFSKASSALGEILRELQSE